MNTKAVTNPLISVIVPVYNTAKYLDKCVTSIINQTYTNLEIILVDDGSTDNSPTMCDSWAEKDSRIKVIHKQNGGAASARNTGLDIMTGELVGFVDSDDYIAPDMYEVLYKIMKDNDADLSICDLIFVDEEGSILNKRVGPPLQNYILSREQALRGLVDNSLACFGSPVKLQRAEIFNHIRFPEGLILEDNITSHYILGRSNKIITTDRLLYFYVQHEDSTLANVREAKFHTLHFESSATLWIDRYNYLISLGMNGLAELAIFKLYAVMINTLRKVNYLQFRQEINKYIWETFRKLLHSKTLKNKLRAGKLILVLLRSLFRPYVKQ